MEMNKKRLVKINNPRLCKIRKELRQLLLMLFETQINNFFDEKDRVRENSGITYNRKQKRLRELSRKIQDLKMAKRSAPLSCSTCSRVDIDLMYNPTVNSWYCVVCYEFNQKASPGLFP